MFVAFVFLRGIIHRFLVRVRLTRRVAVITCPAQTESLITKKISLQEEFVHSWDRDLSSSFYSNEIVLLLL